MIFGSASSFRDGVNQEEEVHGIASSDEVRPGHATSVHVRLGHATHASMFVRVAMRVSRAKWFAFLRRVFHYQNGSRSHVGDNPFNSSGWMMLEVLSLVLQICMSLITLSVSKAEKPLWPMRIWIAGYDFGCVISLSILCWRYVQYHCRQAYHGLNLSDLEQQGTNEDSRNLHVVDKCRASLDLFFAMWFVMGNVWVFDSRFGPFNRAPKLYILCITILAWNAITYSFPFILFLLLCICVPLVSSVVGYNMNMGSADKGASDDQIFKLTCWNFKQVDSSLEAGNSFPAEDNPECCICLAKYREKEQIRKLPCSHNFHQKCVDQWLKIISCCPLCKQGLDG